MRMDELKRGFWGYKKDSVYHYIVSLEEKASERVAEKEAQLEQLKAKMEWQFAEMERKHKKQLAKLEAMVDALQKENAALRGDQASVFSTMLEAQKYAEQLKADSVRQKQQAQERLYAAVRQKTRQFDDYQGQIQQLRSVIRELLKDFDSKIEEAERTLFLPAQVPSAELDDGKTFETGRVSGLVVMPDSSGMLCANEIPAAGQ